MRLERLELTDFRNHPAVLAAFPPGASVLVGPNGVGKTNVLEAIGFLATLGSHRAGQEASLVREGAGAAVIRAVVEREGRKVLLEVELRPGSGVRGRINRAAVPRARDLLGVVRATLFAPEDIALIRGDPEERRRFLDALAVQRLPRYLASRHDYERILRQRNTLLRSAAGRLPSSAGLATLDVWDDKLAAAGAELWAERLRLVERLRPLVRAAYQALASGSDAAVDLVYLSSALGERAAGVLSAGVESRAGAGSGVAAGPAGASGPPVPPSEPSRLARLLRERLLADRAREIERGVTLSGPHRDDVALSLQGLPARSHASHGEAWSLALALRLAAHQLLGGEGEEPVLLLDDVFAELDRRRRERLAAVAMSVEQVIITASVPEELPPKLKAAMFHVEPGKLTPIPERAG